MRGLSDGAKLLYGCSALHEAGEQPVSLDDLAEELGTSRAAIGRYFEELRKHGLIRRRRHGPGRPATCEFLWHPALENGPLLKGADVSKATVADCSRVSNQGGGRGNSGKGLITQKRGQDYSEVSSLDCSKVSNPYKEVQISGIQIIPSDSSSFEVHSTFAEGVAIEGKTDDDEFPS